MGAACSVCVSPFREPVERGLREGGQQRRRWHAFSICRDDVSRFMTIDLAISTKRSADPTRVRGGVVRSPPHCANPIDTQRPMEHR